jgi:ribosome-binding protein aMBF1 (putative translation factor)
MTYCAICENEFSPGRMIDVISKGGIVKVCPGCYRDDMPVFKKPEDYQFEGIYKRKSVYERLSQAAGLNNSEEHKKRISGFGKDSGVLKDEYLRRIVNKNFEKRAENYPKNEDLIDNFHWVILRARRSKKLSQKQLAEAIKEPESAVAMAEKGFIPQGSDFFVRKLEEFLRVRISKKNFEKAREGIFDGEVEKKELLRRFEDHGEFDDEMMKSLTIEDLNELKEKKKKKKWWQFGKKKNSDFEEEDEEELEDDSEEFSDSPFFK